MTTRDFDEVDDAGADVDRPEAFGTGDENEPTVTRISRADLRRYTEQVGGEPDSQATPREPPTVPGTVSTDRPDAATVVFGGTGDEAPSVRSAAASEPADDDEVTPTSVLIPPLVTGRPAERPAPVPPATAVLDPMAADPWTAAPGPAGRPGEVADAAVPDEATLLAERRADRDRALGKRRPQPTPAAVPEPPSTKLGRTTDRFPVALSMFLLRLAVAAILGVRGAQQLMDIPGTIALFAGTALPYPEIFAWATASASVLIAVALVFGLATRIAGLGTMLIGVGALVFVYWWKSPFEAGVAGFHGETELLLAVLGLFLLFAGGGSWGIDAAVRKGRLQRKADRYNAELI